MIELFAGSRVFNAQGSMLKGAEANERTPENDANAAIRPT